MDLFVARNVVKKYINHLALDSVSISVPEGSIYGLLGPNGAGKTTLIRIINQITAPDEGELLLKGKKLKAEDTAMIGYLPEERGLYRKMKVGEQALYLAQLKGVTKSDALQRLKFWFTKFEMQDWWNKKVEELSKGMQQKVQFITTILHEPKLLIFDEPFSGFDPINTNLLKQEVLNLQKNGTTIIFSTHNMASVEELCSHITLINKAKSILSGKVSEIRNRYKPDIFEIDFKGDPEKFNTAVASYCQIINLEQKEEIYNAKLKLTGEPINNQLLNAIIPVVHVCAFNEVLPTMNDIFIRAVEGS